MSFLPFTSCTGCGSDSKKNPYPHRTPSPPVDRCGAPAAISRTARGARHREVPHSSQRYRLSVSPKKGRPVRPTDERQKGRFPTTLGRGGAKTYDEPTGAAHPDRRSGRRGAWQSPEAIRTDFWPSTCAADIHHLRHAVTCVSRRTRNPRALRRGPEVSL